MSIITASEYSYGNQSVSLPRNIEILLPKGNQTSQKSWEFLGTETETEEPSPSAPSFVRTTVDPIFARSSNPNSLSSRLAAAELERLSCQKCKKLGAVGSQFFSE